MTLIILFLINDTLTELPGWGPREAPSEEVCEEWRENTYEYLESLGYSEEVVVITCETREH